MFDFVKGLFGSTNDVEEPKELAAAALPALPPKSEPSVAPPPPPAPERVAERILESGSIEVDFVAVLDDGALGEVDRDRITRAQNLLETLPADAPAGLKRRIVEAAFDVFDVPTSKIIEASSAAIDVIHAYVRKTHEATEREIADSEDRIRKLEASIRDEQAAIERAKELQRQREALAAREVEGIEPIVRFFNTRASMSPAAVEGSTPPGLRLASSPPAPKVPSMTPNDAGAGIDEDLTAALEERASSPPEPAEVPTT